MTAMEVPFTILIIGMNHIHVKILLCFPNANGQDIIFWVGNLRPHLAVGIVIVCILHMKQWQDFMVT